MDGRYCPKCGKPVYPLDNHVCKEIRHRITFVNTSDVDTICDRCDISVPPGARHTCGPISREEAARHIQGDTDAVDFLNTHGGFFSPDLPFRHPMHIKERDIILWPPVDISPTAKIGNGTRIGRYTNIVGDVTIGEHCRLQGFNFIPYPVEIGDFVFIGPGAIFTNVKHPRVRRREEKATLKSVVENHAAIGAGAIILPGIRIGEGALIGAGAIVTHDVPAGETWKGVPARGWVHDG